MAVYRYTVSIPSRSFAEDFKRECKRRGHSQSYVITQAMRYFISHPYAKGWGENGESKGGEGPKRVKSATKILSSTK